MDFFTKTQAKDVMTREVICVQPTTSIRQLSEVFIEKNISSAPVVDNEQNVVGFVTQTDIVELDLHSNDYLESRLEETGGYAQDIMSPVETFARKTDTLATIIDRMCTERNHRLLIFDEQENICGIITTMDVMRYLQKLYKSVA